jgi:hypothetical protein
VGRRPVSRATTHSTRGHWVRLMRPNLGDEPFVVNPLDVKRLSPGGQQGSIAITPGSALIRSSSVLDSSDVTETVQVTEL